MPNPEKGSKASANATHSVDHADDVMEAQLQQELRSMFEVDTQKRLQTYLDEAGHLQAQTWTDDIQKLYRAIHTIKGGAVTVGAEAILPVATVLEDLLSDLRHLETAPPLEDGQLAEMLIEAGELLAATLSVQAIDDAARTQIEAAVAQIEQLRSRIQAQYLPQWSPQKQFQQEFAREGLDLVVLDLEIALENLTDADDLPANVCQIARNLIEQLGQIGRDLQLAAGWTTLLGQAEPLLSTAYTQHWKTQWPRLFQAFKACVRIGGEPVDFTLQPIDTIAQDDRRQGDWAQASGPPSDASSSLTATPSDADDRDLESDLNVPGLANPDISELEEDDLFTDMDTFLGGLGSLTNSLNGMEQDDPSEVTQEQLEGTVEAAETMDWIITDPVLTPEQAAFEPDDIESDVPTTPVTEASAADATETNGAIDSQSTSLTNPDAMTANDWVIEESAQANMLSVTNDVAPDSADTWLTNLLSEALDTATMEPAEGDESVPTMPLEASSGSADLAEQIQIPVPLERLDRSAQDLINALLSVRSTQDIYKTLQAQILQLASLAQEGIQHITRLRQIQDDYALVDNLKLNSSTGPAPERYRQGYVTINRLLETNLRLSELGAETEKSTKYMTDSLQFLDRNILRLQATVEESRLVSFRNLAFRSRAILRDLTTRFTQSARLVIQGEQTELDVGSARSLEPALLHLIRNAFSHGIEPPEERETQGKPSQGTLTLSLQRLGNLYRLSFQDDGRGINAAAVRDRAIALDLPLNDTSTTAKLLAVICQPGFSSDTTVNDISGRGVGMDVVAAQIAKLGGKLTLDTTPGGGTTFSLQFPVPHLLVSCVMLRRGDRTFAIPIEDIRNVALLETLTATSVEAENTLYAWQIKTGDSTTPGLDLLEYWQPQSANRPLEETAVCAYIQAPSSEQGVWLIADDLLEQSDLLINSLPDPLQPPEGLMGISLQPDGTLVPVLNVTAMIDWLYTHPHAAIANAQTPLSLPQQPTETVPPTILIVDDAALMRRRIEASLASYGHLTYTCGDGLEAWNWLKANPAPALLITDIEMPHMDGFTLIDRCRQERLSMPILVVSSRLSEDWFAEAQRLGANDYLTKGFATVDLVNKVNQLVADAS